MRIQNAAVCVAAALFATGMFVAAARADEVPPLSVTPSQTKVLIVPTLDETGDRAEMQQEHVVVSNHRLEYEFMTRGFQLIGPAEALRAARAEGIDLDDPDGHGANSLKALGKDTGADWVVSAAVIDVHDDKNSGFSIFFSNRRAYAKVEIKVFDMHQDGYIENRFELQHKTTVRAMPGPNGIGTTGLFKDALDTTVQRSVANLLSPYPQTVHVDGEFSEDDLVDRTPNAPEPAAVPAVTASAPAAPVVAPTALASPPHATPTVTTKFAKKDGEIVIGIIDHHDATDGVYFVKVASGTTIVEDSDIASMTTVAPSQTGGSGQ